MTETVFVYGMLWIFTHIKRVRFEQWSMDLCPGYKEWEAWTCPNLSSRLSALDRASVRHVPPFWSVWPILQAVPWLGCHHPPLSWNRFRFRNIIIEIRVEAKLRGINPLPKWLIKTNNSCQCLYYSIGNEIPLTWFNLNSIGHSFVAFFLQSSAFLSHSCR